MTAGCRVLVIGRNGQLAAELSRAKWPAGWMLTPVGLPDLDLRVPDRAASFVASAAPDLVVNAAAYTNVEKAEHDYDLARLVNAAGPAAVARACAQIGAAFVTISSDYVFDGEKPSPYVEDDEVHPISAYGRTKAEGEALVRAALSRHVILRTSWVFSPFGANFVKTMLRLGCERPVIRVVADQRGCPTAAGYLARAIVAVCRSIRSGDPQFGTFHVTNEGATSWFELAAATFDGLAARREPLRAQLMPITTAEFSTKARRPANSELDCTRFRTSFGVTMRPWREALADCLDEIAVQPTAAAKG